MSVGRFLRWPLVGPDVIKMEIIVSRALYANNLKMTLAFLATKRFYSSELSNIRSCYRVIGVPYDSDQETVRLAYIELVKKYHPDSKSTESDSAKFQEVETAYRTLQAKFTKDRFNVNDCEGEYGLYYKEKEGQPEVEQPDIKHTAPQHRQYLSHEGFGMGTPSQREKQFTQYRAAKAAQNVSEYKISRAVNMDDKAVQARKEKAKVKDIRTGLGMDRLVEDLIQESMTRGDFDNLTGAGKPLKKLQSTHNPYVDFTTHKINEVLIDNGFTPQWITLQKEIRDHLDKIRISLERVRGKLGTLPLNDEDEAYWKDHTTRLEDDVKDLNAKIDFYNLVVPILNKQMTHLHLESLTEKILKEGKPSEVKKTRIEVKKSEPSNGFLNRISSILWG